MSSSLGTGSLGSSSSLVAGGFELTVSWLGSISRGSGWSGEVERGGRGEGWQFGARYQTVAEMGGETVVREEKVRWQGGRRLG